MTAANVGPQWVFDGRGAREEMRPVPGLPGYLVTATGAVYSTIATKGAWAKRLRPKADRDGYLTIEATTGEGRKNLRVHRMVALAFLGAAPGDRHEVRHLDGDPANNGVGNLAWGTHAENMADRAAHGRNPKGARNGRARLDAPAVGVVRALLARGRTMPVVARHFGVTTGAIAEIARGDNWPDVAAANDDAVAPVERAIAAACAAEVARLEGERATLEASLVFDPLPAGGALEGRRAGRLVLEAPAEPDRFGHAQWRCRCDCGRGAVAREFMLRQRRAVSCGCYARERSALGCRLRFAAGWLDARSAS